MRAPFQNVLASNLFSWTAILRSWTSSSFLFNVFRNLSADVMFFLSIAVTDCYLVILKTSSFASIAFVSCSVVLVMMFSLSWKACHFCPKWSRDKQSRYWLIRFPLFILPITNSSDLTINQLKIAYHIPVLASPIFRLAHYNASVTTDFMSLLFLR